MEARYALGGMRAHTRRLERVMHAVGTATPSRRRHSGHPPDPLGRRRRPRRDTRGSSLPSRCYQLLLDGRRLLLRIHSLLLRRQPLAPQVLERSDGELVAPSAGKRVVPFLPRRQVLVVLEAGERLAPIHVVLEQT